MNRYDEIETIVFSEIEKNCFGHKKQHGYQHLFTVSTLCLKLSYKYKLDSELCAIMGLLHDYSVYKNNSRFNHAFMSSELSKTLLESTNLFTQKEIDIIITAIKNHSSKDKRDDEYSELLKLCDVLASYLHEPDMILEPNRQRFIDYAKSEKLI